MNLLYTVNPSKRRRKAKRAHSRKHRSAAQRTATARLVAMNRSRRARRSHPMAAHSNPRPRRRVRHALRRVARRVSRRFRRNPFSLPSMAGAGGVVGLLKSGVVGGAGAVLVDVGMGYTTKVLPASMSSPINADGSANWMYVGIKTALALALGTAGRKLPVVGKVAGQMAEGALSVLAYQIMRPMVPAAISLGYLNPAPTMRPQAGVGRYLSGAGAYAQLPVRSNNGGPTRAASPRGSNAAQVLSLVGNRKTVAGR